jgi:Flp pilus assembly protein TadB
MVEDERQKAVPRSRPRALFGLNEQVLTERGNSTLVRVCMIVFGIAIVAIAPVVWIWKIVLFLLIMFLVGVLMPAIRRARHHRGEGAREPHQRLLADDWPQCRRHHYAHAVTTVDEL